MLVNPTVEKLRAMRLTAMAEAFTEQLADPEMAQLSFEERVALMVDRQWTWRENRALDRRLKNARLKLPACLEDINYRRPRGLDRSLVASLATGRWIQTHHNLIIVGPCGVGKTFLACAFAQKAAREGWSALYTRAARLFRDLALARALRKSRRSLSTYLGELQSRGLCQLTVARNQHEHTRLQICEPFWPYRRSPAREPEVAESQYVDQIARLLLDAPGVQCSFSPADRQLAARFYRQGLSLPQIEQALLLGCARKHVAWLNGHTGGAITSLSYFEPLIQEVRQQPVSDPYWDYLRSRLRTLSQQWRHQSADANFASATHARKERRDDAFLP